MSNITKLGLTIFALLYLQNLFGQAIFTSSATGNWSDNTIWTVGLGTDEDGIPDANDSAIIAGTHTITVDVNSAVNGLRLQGASSGTRLILGENNLEVNGTLNGDGTSLSTTLITAGSTGRIKFVGNTRPLFGTNWTANTPNLRFEVALNAGQTGTASTNIKAKEIIVTTGFFDLVTNELRPDNDAPTTGILTIETGGIVRCLRLSRTSSQNIPFAALNMNGNAILRFNSTGSSSNYAPAVQTGFPVYTLSNTSTIEYVGSSSGTISVIPYKNLSIILANSGGSRTFGAANTIDGNLVITTATVTASTGTITINGNVTVNTDAVLTAGSNGVIYTAAGVSNTLTINSGGIVETVNRNISNTPPAAGTTTPFSTQFAGFESLVLNAGSTVSYAVPGGTVMGTQDIQTTYGVTPINYQNLRIRMTGSTTSQGATHYLPIGVSVAGTLSILHPQGGSSIITTTHDLTLVGTGTLTVPALTITRSLANIGGTSTSNYTLATDQNLTVTGATTLNSAGLRFSGNPTITFGGNVTTGNGTNAGSSGTIFNFNGNAPTLNFNSNLTIGNTSSVNFTGASAVNLKGALTVNSGITLTTGDVLKIVSDDNGTGRIANSNGSTISGNITIQRYIPSGTRRFRFLSHPFNTARPINILSGLSYTGTGGVDSGFTHTTLTNNPSVFSFTTFNGNGALNDAGWTAITKASTANWGIGQGIRILVRGTLNEGLDGNAYSPSATTINMTGAVNAGVVNIPLVLGGSGSSENFNLVGNPYPSPVNIEDVVTSNTNVSKTIYLRNPSTGSYITKDLSVLANADYSVPSNAAFFVVPTVGTSLAFAETNKVATASADVVFNQPANDPLPYIELQTLVNQDVYDNMYIKFDKNWSAKFDHKTDATKAQNDFVNVYAISEEGRKLAVDARSFIHNSIIPLGVTLNSGSRTLTIKASTFNIDNDLYEVTLFDKLTNTKTVLSKDASYSFVVNMNEANSYGNDRLQLLLSLKKTIQPINDVIATGFRAKLQSTIIGGQIAVQLENAVGKTTIKVVNALGQIVVSKDASNITSGTVNIASNALGKGVYFVQVQNGDNAVTLQATKQ